jgi:hypothetical protein
VRASYAVEAAPVSALEVAMVFTFTRFFFSIRWLRTQLLGKTAAHLLVLVLELVLVLPVWMTRRNADDIARVCI